MLECFKLVIPFVRSAIMADNQEGIKEILLLSEAKLLIGIRVV